MNWEFANDYLTQSLLLCKLTMFKESYIIKTKEVML